MSLKKKVVKGFAWTSLQQTASQLISFLVFLVLARLLDPESFGLVAMATVVIAFFEVFSHFGFGAAIIQRDELEKAHLDTAFWADIGVRTVTMTVAVLLAGWAATLYGEARLAPVIQALSVTFVVSALSQVQTSILRRKLAFRTLAIRTLAAEIIGGISGVVLAMNGFGVWSLVARQLVTSLSGVVILWILSDWRPGLAVSRKHFKDLFGFSVNMMGLHMVNFFSRRSDSFLIGYFLGATQLGYYTVAFRLVRMLTQSMGGTINRVTWPAFARLQKDPKRLRKGFYSASQILALVIFPIFMGISALAPELVPLLFGDKWTHSILLMQILAFLGITESMSRIYNSVIVSVGRPGVLVTLRTLLAICNIIALLVALQWGLRGMAIAYVIVAYLFMPIYLVLLRKLAGINISKYFRYLVPPAAATVLMVLVIFACKTPLAEIGSPMVQVAILGVMGAIIYAGVLTLVSPAIVRHVLNLFRMVLPGKGS